MQSRSPSHSPVGVNHLELAESLNQLSTMSNDAMSPYDLGLNDDDVGPYDNVLHYDDDHPAKRVHKGVSYNSMPRVSPPHLRGRLYRDDITLPFVSSNTPDLNDLMHYFDDDDASMSSLSPVLSTISILSDSASLSPLSSLVPSGETSRALSGRSTPYDRFDKDKRHNASRRGRSRRGISTNDRPMTIIPNSGLVNPFQTNGAGKWVRSVLEEQELLDDMSMLRKTGSEKEPVPHRLVVKASVEPKKALEGDDNCTACLGKGQLLCCDTCPRVFHLHCLPEAFDEDNPPEGTWKCRRCTFDSNRATLSKNLKLTFSLKKPIEVKKRSDPMKGIMERVLDVVDRISPRVFELPKFMRETRGIFTHPSDGTFIPVEHTSIERVYNKPRITRAAARKDSDAKPLMDKKKSKENHSVELTRSRDDQEEEEKEDPLCHICCKTEFVPRQTLFLGCSLVDQPGISGTNHLQLNATRSQMIHCDYCDSHWHLDCLDPPLPAIPPELRKHATDSIDIGEILYLQDKIWGRDESPLDDLDQYLEHAPPKRAYEWDLQTMYDANVRYLEVRRKWMCPCHFEFAQLDGIEMAEQKATKSNQRMERPDPVRKSEPVKMSEPTKKSEPVQKEKPVSTRISRSRDVSKTEYLEPYNFFQVKSAPSRLRSRESTSAKLMGHHSPIISKVKEKEKLPVNSPRRGPSKFTIVNDEETNELFDDSETVKKEGTVLFETKVCESFYQGFSKNRTLNDPVPLLPKTPFDPLPTPETVFKPVWHFFPNLCIDGSS